MAVVQVDYYSKAISRITTFRMVLPNDVLDEVKAENPHYKRPVKTLFLLHGFSGNSMDWLAGASMQELSQKYNLAIITPSGDNSFYLNSRGTGNAYETLVGVEVVEYVRKTFGLSEKKEDTFIGGLSMGGFGAIHTALKYPETFGKMFGLSSAMIIHDVQGMKPGEQNDVADYDYYERIFGDPEKVEASTNNPETLILNRLNAGDKIQKIFMACGTEDFLISQNRQFRDFLIKNKVDLTYKESKGVHDWKFWNEYLEPAILWLLEEKK